jgi:ribosomal protein L7/L12
MANVVVNDPSCDSKPIPQIRLLRERLGISLRDAKVAIEAARERKRQAQAGADLAEV